jgi:hypothetical protein
MNLLSFRIETKRFCCELLEMLTELMPREDSRQPDDETTKWKRKGEISMRFLCKILALIDDEVNSII